MTTELIVSYGTEMVGSRYRVKISKMDNGVNPESFMVAIQDLLEGGFTIRNYTNKDCVTNILKLLHESVKSGV